MRHLDSCCWSRRTFPRGPVRRGDVFPSVTGRRVPPQHERARSHRAAWRFNDWSGTAFCLWPRSTQARLAGQHPGSSVFLALPVLPRPRGGATGTHTIVKRSTRATPTMRWRSALNAPSSPPHVPLTHPAHTSRVKKKKRVARRRLPSHNPPTPANHPAKKQKSDPFPIHPPFLTDPTRKQVSVFFFFWAHPAQLPAERSATPSHFKAKQISPSKQGSDLRTWHRPRILSPPSLPPLFTRRSVRGSGPRSSGSRSQRGEGGLRGFESSWAEWGTPRSGEGKEGATCRMCFVFGAEMRRRAR